VNVEAYISSGILESYAQGELSEQERLEVENNLRAYPELRKELSMIEDVQEALLQKAAQQPRASVKLDLFAKIDAGLPVTKVVPLPVTTTSATNWKLAVAAAVTIALISSYLAYDYRDKWIKTQGSLTQLIAQNQRVAQDYNQVNQRLNQLETDLNILNNPAFERIVMTGRPNTPNALASVYWNKSSQEVYLSIQDMKTLTAEKQYQLWAIIDGKPVDAGVFDGSFTGLLKMKNITSGASTFAVTIEPKGGSKTPSLETMQVAGNVIKG